ncbi:MAG TPA: protein-glutamate O-methyltransferase CheR, partial [Longimicrobiaceae bacterium]|nr:protein-glutamate O-methyltransferase CheR [Longimicrobiaceae bacterium]
MTDRWTPLQLEPLLHWIAGRTGLVHDEQRHDAAVAAVEQLAKRTSLSDPRALRRRLEADSGALDDFLAELTIGETYFLRDPKQMAVIREEVLPDVAAHRGERGLRLWSAGCSTGEEPYSLAILLKEHGLGTGAEVLGTDLSRARLAVARRGRYRAWSFRGVPDEVRDRYFHPAGSEWELSPAIRAAVDFRYLNLVEDRFPSLSTGVWGMDLILCRNVLIYLDADSRRQVVRKLFDSLAEGGWLLLGASDPLVANEIPAEVVVTAAGLAYRRSGRYARRAAPPPPAEPPRYEPTEPEESPVPPVPLPAPVPVPDLE